MADSVNVRETQTLTDLRNALGRFAESTTQSLQAFDTEIRRTVEWLRERVLYWQREVERARINVQRAEAALHHCESQVYVDRNGHAHYPDCSAYRRALQQAQQVLIRAEQSLAVATRWQSSVGQAVQQYQSHSARMKQITKAQTGQGKTFLERKLGELGEYARLVPAQAATATQSDADRRQNLYVNPTAAANSRALTLQELLPEGHTRNRVTMGAAVVEDAHGNRFVVIGTSEPNGYLRPEVRAAIEPGEVVASGIGHAEQNIVRHCQANGWNAITVGAGRPICPDCAIAIESVNGTLASAKR